MADSASRIRRKQEEAERQRQEQEEAQRRLRDQAAVKEAPPKTEYPLVDFTKLPNGMPLAEGLPVMGKNKTVIPTATEDAHFKRFLADNGNLTFKSVALAAYRLLVQEEADALAAMNDPQRDPGKPIERPLYAAISEEVVHIKAELAILKTKASA
ncbi:hypothetical protein ACWD7M_17060 [Streptomyces griseus]